MRFVIISDLDFRGSGYFNIVTPLADGLSKLGHEVKIAGLGYKGEEHTYPFSIIPATNIQETLAITQNLYNVWGFDVLIVALDIPIQERILLAIGEHPFKYVGIMPIEADPLCMSWAAVLMQMDSQWIISKFGTEEAHKAGVETAQYFEVGIDTNSWKPPTSEERANLRKGFGFTDEDFVILTVADNQERKNLPAAFEAVQLLKKVYGYEHLKYMLVTRENNLVGWKLRDLADQFDIHGELMIFERGMPFKELWALYAMADAFVMSSKAEGLNLPLLEAMAMEVPAIGTGCTGIKELIGNDNERGMLVYPEYTHIDPFGNGKRYWINASDLAQKLGLSFNSTSTDEKVTNARKFVEDRNWSDTVSTFADEMQKLIDKDKKDETKE